MDAWAGLASCDIFLVSPMRGGPMGIGPCQSGAAISVSLSDYSLSWRRITSHNPAIPSPVGRGRMGVCGAKVMRLFLQANDRRVRLLIGGCLAAVVAGIAVPVSSELKPFEAARRLREHGLVQLARVDRMSFVASTAGREALAMRSPALAPIAREGLPRLHLAAVPPVIFDDAAQLRSGPETVDGGQEGVLLLPSLSLRDEAPQFGFGFGSRVVPPTSAPAPVPLLSKGLSEAPLPSPGGPVGWFPLVVVMVRHAVSEPAFGSVLARLAATKPPAGKTGKSAKKAAVEDVEEQDEPSPPPKRAAAVVVKPAAVPAPPPKPVPTFGASGPPTWAKFDSMN